MDTAVWTSQYSNLWRWHKYPALSTPATVRPQQKSPCKIRDLFIYQWNCLNIYHTWHRNMYLFSVCYQAHFGLIFEDISKKYSLRNSYKSCKRVYKWRNPSFQQISSFQLTEQFNEPVTFFISYLFATVTTKVNRDRAGRRLEKCIALSTRGLSSYQSSSVNLYWTSQL